MQLSIADRFHIIGQLLRKDVELTPLGTALEESRRGVRALHAELDEAERQWHTTFDSISDGVCLLDSEGRLLRVNDSMLRLLRSSPDQVLGRVHADVLADALGILDLPGMVPSVAGGRRQVAEVQAGDCWYTLTFDLIPSEPAGAAAGGVLIVTDISERKRLEAQRGLAERAQTEAVELDRMKSDFLNLASHELRGPLAVLRGYISMLEDGSLGLLTDSMREAMPVMTAKMREMNILVNQMLDTARLEDSRLVLSRERVDLRDVLAAAAEQMGPIAGEHHRIRIESGAEPAMIDGDRNRLTTILTNLVDNAIKYSPAGGEVRCTLRVAAERAALSVSDCGLGIDQEDLPRLFKRFGRLLNAENSHIPGTGLGLYLSRELARMHGGDVGVASELGEGTTFTLDLPLATNRRGGSLPQVTARAG